MTSTYGIPVWGSYCIFAVLTIIAGLLLGLVSSQRGLPIYSASPGLVWIDNEFLSFQFIVYLCDAVFPPSPPPQYPGQHHLEPPKPKAEQETGDLVRVHSPE